MSFTTLSRQICQKNNLQTVINNFISYSGGMPVILDFLDNPYSVAINPSTGNPWGFDRYNSAIGYLHNFVIEQQEILNSNVATASSVYRLIASLPAGNVWYDSNNTSTYATFLSNTISSNANTKSAFLQALLSDDGYGYEEKSDTLKNYFPTGEKETRVTVRFGPSKYSVVGLLGLSLNVANLANP